MEMNDYHLMFVTIWRFPEAQLEGVLRMICLKQFARGSGGDAEPADRQSANAELRGNRCLLLANIVAAVPHQCRCHATAHHLRA